MDHREVYPFTQTPDLLTAWRDTLPGLLPEGDHAAIESGPAGPASLLIHIDATGHSMYGFDFQCTYADDREVDVQPIQAYREGHSAPMDESIARELIHDYTRHIHEAAQSIRER